MKLIKYPIVLLLIGVIVACGEEKQVDADPVKTSSRSSIDSLENDMISFAKSSPDELEELDKKKGVVIDSLLRYYRQYPTDTMTPSYLDKVHMLYSGMGKARMASNYADVILENYKNYVNRQMVLESQITNYDVSIHPRDTVAIRKWITVLLSEAKDLDQEARNNYQFILDNIGMSWGERVKAQN